VMNYGHVTLENSTLSGNTARFGGGGIYNDYFVRNLTTYMGTATLHNSTIARNTVTSGLGGGIRNEGILELSRSLISGNKGRFGIEIYHNTHFSGGVAADNFNLFGAGNYSGVEGFTPGASDIVPAVGVSKIIGPLSPNGGATKTHRLVIHSPAINEAPVDAECPATDQRGYPRPAGAGCDIGAFEKQ
jgi:hypothetical protein